VGRRPAPQPRDEGHARQGRRLRGPGRGLGRDRPRAPGTLPRGGPDHGQLDHPGVVPVHDLGIDSQGRCYFTMRFVRGRELKDVLDHYARARRAGRAPRCWA
jgi:hypothetical protein